MDRRVFMTRAAALGCSIAASPLVTPVALANAPWDTRLIVILLRGGMDGIDAIRPVGDQNFSAMRPSLNRDTIELTDFYGLNNGLRPLLPLWQAGDFGIAHATSTPYRGKRSHFDGQDVLEAGTIGGLRDGSDGWLNRMLQTVPGITGQTSYSIGREQQLILSGGAPTSSWSPEAKLAMTPQAELLLRLVYENDPLFSATSTKAIEIAQTVAVDAERDEQAVQSMMDSPMMAQINGKAEHVKLANFAADRLRGNTRIASFSVNGWDTHANQRNGLGRALRRLSDTILTLRTGLDSVWDKTAILCLTEFGRTARENGTKGTDHGTGGAMIYAGGALNGGRVLGDWPGLGTSDLLNQRDLMPTRDVRAYPAWVMHGLLGIDRRAIELSIFPGLEMGPDPGILG